MSDDRHIGHDIWDFVIKEKELIDKKESRLSRADRDEVLRLYEIGRRN